MLLSDLVSNLGAPSLQAEIDARQSGLLALTDGTDTGNGASQQEEDPEDVAAAMLTALGAGELADVAQVCFAVVAKAARGTESEKPVIRHIRGPSTVPQTWRMHSGAGEVADVTAGTSPGITVRSSSNGV